MVATHLQVRLAKVGTNVIKPAKDNGYKYVKTIGEVVSK
jgi:hypothetical protein